MAKCQIADCKLEAKHVVKIKKSEEDDRVYKVCPDHCESLKADCKKNKWEFMEIN